MKNRAFTMIELLLSVALLLIIGLGFFASMRYYKATGLTATKKAINLNEMRGALDKLKHDLLIAKGVYNNDYSAIASGLSASFAGQTTGTSRLIVKVPSVNASNNFINLYEDKYTDYYVYYLSGGKLIRKTYTSTETGSARPTTDYILGEGFSSITFGDGLNYLGNASAYNDVDDFNRLRHVEITLNAVVEDTPGGQTHTESLTLKVSFRNF